jgi:hypothetical protein
MPNPSDIPTAVAFSETVYRRPLVEIDDGVTELVPQQNVVMAASAEDTNVITVTGQVYDYQDVLERATELFYYVASDALGTTRAAATDVAVSTGDVIDIFTAESSARFVTDADGAFVIAVTGDATPLWLVVTYGESSKQFIVSMPFAA